MPADSPKPRLDDWSFDTEDGLRIHATRRPEGPILTAFHAGYDRAFVLPDEKEDLAGFAACLALNHDPAYTRLAGHYGPFCEVCLIAEDLATGGRIGGANLIALDHGGLVTANLNYVYIDPEARGTGRLDDLLAGVRHTIGGLFVGPMLLFIEQNDPLAMSAAAYAHDSAYTGLDQLDRLRIWARRGARVVDIPYVQPALSAAQAPDPRLVYSVLGATGTSIPACLLERHLRGFFGISVLKGAALASNEVADRQVRDLAAACAARASIDLLDPTDLLARLRGPADLDRLGNPRPANLRAALAGHA
ncbi:MAG: hypothetical protein R3D98_05090 [Candidatus Krumholzibacteriia bacterium]